MKYIGRADRAAEESLKVMNERKRTSVRNSENHISRSEPALDKSDALRLKVFIADDSIEIRNRLKEMLNENKSIHLVGEAGDTDQALVGLGHQKPDVIILDIHMPGGGGMRVLEDSKTRYSGMIAIVLTVFPYPQYRQAYLNAGADYFFDKTVDLQKMMDVLAELAEKRSVNRNSNEK